MVTGYGKILRKIRIENCEVLGHMAKKLDISISYLSSIENGERNLPKGFTEKVSQVYSLSKKEKIGLDKAEQEYIRETKISLKNVSSIKRETALIFARTFNDINDKEMEEIKRLLTKKENK